MRTDSQARAAHRRAAIQTLLPTADADNWWDAYDALLDLGVTVDEIEESYRES